MKKIFLLLFLSILAFFIIGCSDVSTGNTTNTADSIKENPSNNYNPGGEAEPPRGGLDPSLGEKTNFEVTPGVIDYGTVFEFSEISIEKTNSGYNLLRLKFKVLPEFMISKNDVKYKIATEDIYQSLDDSVVGCDINSLNDDTYGIEVLSSDDQSSRFFKQGEEVQICIKSENNIQSKDELGLIYGSSNSREGKLILTVPKLNSEKVVLLS